MCRQRDESGSAGGRYQGVIRRACGPDGKVTDWLASSVLGMAKALVLVMLSLRLRFVALRDFARGDGQRVNLGRETVHLFWDTER